MIMKIKYIALCLLLVLVGCQRDEEMEITQLTISSERIEPSYSSVSISCNIISNVTIKEAKVYVSKTTDFSSATTQVLENRRNAFTAEVSGLADGATYYVRYQISNRWVSLMAEEISEFQTIPATEPTVTTTQPKEITHNSAIMGGMIVDNGGLTVTNCGVVYSKSPNPTIENGTKVESKEKTESFTCTINDLDFATSYYARAYAINEKGTAYGEEISFKTNGTTASLDTLSISDVTATSAVISGALLNNGGEPITALGVCYGVNQSPTLEDATVINAELDGLKFSVLLNDLQKGTTYYVRAYATNSHGTVYSEELYFNSEMTIPAVTTTPAIDISYTSATVGGNVTENGGASVTERGVCYSISANPTTSNTKITSGSGLGEFTCNLSDLQDGMTYYARAYAINEKGIAYGDEVRFTTKTKTIATVATTPATNVSYTSATVGGNVTEDGGAEVTERGVVYATTQNPTTAGTKVTKGSGLGQFTCNLTDLQDNTTYYARAYAINEKGVAYGEEVSFTTKALSGIENGYTWVDLGLSVKWASYNIGATKPEEYGDYFAWGETEPKELYAWSTYKHCQGSDNTLTKYNTNGGYGTVDNKTQLELTDDAARANWGGSWRMPTDAEMTELRNNCTWSWTTQNGVMGYKVTSKSNGNSIFLPAAGYRSLSSLVSAGSNGAYWSSSLYTDDYPGATWYVFFKSSNVYRSYGGRSNGHSVRPVLGESVVETTIPTVTTTIPNQITETSALGGGNVISGGNASVTERGVCIATVSNPTTSNTKITAGSGTGSFTCNLTGLQANTTYYVRAYAVNSMGTAYGEQVSFTTKEQSSTPIDDTETITVNGVSFKMVAVEGGTFTMGATSEQGTTDPWADEYPTHSVTLSDFYIGETEVTQELWQAVMGSNPSYFSGTNLPVEKVSWYDCQTFIQKLNQLTGKQFRLLTEAEWEYAARGGIKSKGYKYAGSNTLNNVAWYLDNSGSKTHPVKQKQPNELGLYDMSGNVYEWCQDLYGNYSSDAQTNPTGLLNGSNGVYRGGGWGGIERRCRVSYRGDYNLMDGDSDLGLRLAL